MGYWDWLRGPKRPTLEADWGLGSVREPAPVAPQHDLPHFHSVGSDLGPLGGGGIGVRERVRDAFSPSRPINDPRLFAGRGEVLRTLIRSIEDLRLNVVIFGERGIGKTSLLHTLAYLAREAKYRVAYHSCGEDARFSDTFRAIAREIPLLFDLRYGPSADETEQGQTLADILPPGDFTVSELSDAFSHLANTRVLIMLDEFDRSSSSQFRRSIAELIKNLADRSARVQIVIAGVAHDLVELFEHIPSIRRNVYGLRVPEMSGDEVGELVEIGESASGLRFSDVARDRVALLANGSPYLGSLLAQYGGFNALDAGLMDVEVDHVNLACRQVADELRHRLPDRTVAATDRAIAAGKGPVLLLLAGLAMRSMGRLDQSIVQGRFDTAPFIAVAEDLRRNYNLLTEQPLEGDRRFVFVEESLPLYLWAKLASSNPAVARDLAELTD